MGDLPAAPPFVQENARIGKACEPMRQKTVPRQGDQLLAIFLGAEVRLMRASESADPENARNFSRIFNESNYTLSPRADEK